ncbi:hypothetical protein HGRIS_007671 [Hohenbuehelia grisea]|uniref:Uncharacterized protein n=1 Tax=Hohenbuehelia grisea TaxID=104357 RepID=A0ABR3J5I8_9AGAR
MFTPRRALETVVKVRQVNERVKELVQSCKKLDNILNNENFQQMKKFLGVSATKEKKKLGRKTSTRNRSATMFQAKLARQRSNAHSRKAQRPPKDSASAQLTQECAMAEASKSERETRNDGVTEQARDFGALNMVHQ